MALEAVVFQQDLFGYNSKDLYNLVGAGNWPSYDFGLEKQEDDDEEEEHEHFPGNQTLLLHGDHWMTTTATTATTTTTTTTTCSNSSLPPHYHHHHPHQLHHPNSLSDAATPTPTTTTTDYANNGSTSGGGCGGSALLDSSTIITPCSRPKRRRAKSRKNKEEIENQRMTHIAVERNRRKQMNEYLSVLRSLMPESYVQRGDQASIIGGAINFVKELEQRLQWLSAQSEVKETPFAEFFTFPQYSTTTGSNRVDNSTAMNEMDHQCGGGGGGGGVAVADIEVTMVESHANLKIRSKKRPAQLLKLVAGLNTMRLTILHLNVTTVDQTVLYSLSVKVEDDCKLTSVDDIATAVNQLLGRIQEGA